MWRIPKNTENSSPAAIGVYTMVDVLCKNCDYFNELVGNPNYGQCRRLPPRGIDTKSLPEGTDPVNVFPMIDDGETEFCGQFKLIRP